MTTFTREDYDMAAKAAGYAIIGDLHPSDGVNVVIGGRVYLWRPSDEDGDAFRLANRLRICVEFGSCEDDAPLSGLDSLRIAAIGHGTHISLTPTPPPAMPSSAQPLQSGGPCHDHQDTRRR